MSRRDNISVEIDINTSINAVGMIYLKVSIQLSGVRYQVLRGIEHHIKIAMCNYDLASAWIFMVLADC